jgi:hypothetical protein
MKARRLVVFIDQVPRTFQFSLPVLVSSQDNRFIGVLRSSRVQAGAQIGRHAAALPDFAPRRHIILKQIDCLEEKIGNIALDNGSFNVL